MSNVSSKSDGGDMDWSENVVFDKSADKSASSSVEQNGGRRFINSNGIKLSASPTFLELKMLTLARKVTN